MADQPTTPDSAYFADESGRVFAVDPADAADVQRAGLYKPATPEQIATHQKSATYGTMGQQILTGIEGLGRGATLGLSTVAERALGVSPEGIKAREEVNPTISTASEIGGIAAPILLTGGAAAPAAGAAEAAERVAPSLLRSAAELTAPSQVARLGRGVAGAVGSAEEGAGVVRKVLQRAAAEGLGSAVEGAAYGAGNLVHEAALGDPKLTADNVISEVGLSALLGGGLGSALGLGIGATEEAVNAGRGAVGRMHDWFLENYPQIGARLSGASPEDIAFLQSRRAELAAGKTPREILAERSALVEPQPPLPGEPPTKTIIPQPVVPKDPEELQKSFKDSLRDVLRSDKDAISEAWMKFRPEEQQLAADANQKDVLQSGLRAFSKFNGAIRELEEKPWVSSMYASKLESVRDAMVDAMEGGDPVDYRLALVDARQAIDSFAKWGGILSPAEREGVGIARGVRDAIKTELEDVGTWGESAARESAVNSAFSEYSNAKKDLRFLMDKESRGGGAVYTPSASNIRSFIRNMGDEANADKEARLTRFLRSSEALHDEIEQSSRFAAASDYDRGAAQSLIDRTRGVVGDSQVNADAERVVADAQQAQRDADAGYRTRKEAFDAQEKAKKADFSELQKSFKQAVKDHGAVDKGAATALEGPSRFGALDVLGLAESLHNPLAAPLYLGYRALKLGRSPVETLHALASLERLNQSVGQRISGAASTLARGGSRALAVGRTEALPGIAKSVGLPEGDARKLYDRRVSQVQQFQADPSVTASALAGSVMALRDHAPETSQNIQQSVTAKMQYLSEHVPDTSPNGPLAEPRRPNRDEVATFHRLFEVVNDPIILLKHAAAQTIRTDEVDAVKTTAPAMYEAIVNGTLDQIAKHGLPSYRQRRAISILLGGDVDGTMSPTAIAANQMVYQRDVKQMGQVHPQPRNPPPKSRASEATALPTQKIEAGLD